MNNKMNSVIDSFYLQVRLGGGLRSPLRTYIIFHVSLARQPLENQFCIPIGSV